MATTTTTPWVRDTRIDVVDIAWEVSVAKSSDRRARKPLTPGGDRAAGRKTLFATRTPVTAGCAPGDAPRASPTRSERMVSCVRTLRFLEMLPVDILAGWSVLGARQRERVDELDCLFQCRQKSRLKYIAPRANEEIRKSDAENTKPRISLGERNQWTDSESRWRASSRMRFALDASAGSSTCPCARVARRSSS